VDIVDAIAIDLYVKIIAKKIELIEKIIDINSKKK